jgi:leucyl/phenylalanyl-tRNA---protein transferase
MPGAAAPEPDLATALAAYAQGLFPMDDLGAQHEPLPFYTADPRTILEVDDAALARVRRKLRRSLARDPGWQPAVDRAFPAVLAGCSASRPGDGVWLTPRLGRLYERMHAAGYAHSWELWDGDELLFGAIGVRLGAAVMLESMFHRRPHAGNVGLVRTLERLAADGVELCDVQLPTPHTLRLGAVEIPASSYARRLRRAVGTRP